MNRSNQETRQIDYSVVLILYNNQNIVIFYISYIFPILLVYEKLLENPNSKISSKWTETDKSK